MNDLDSLRSLINGSAVVNNLKLGEAIQEIIDDRFSHLNNYLKEGEDNLSKPMTRVIEYYDYRIDDIKKKCEEYTKEQLEEHIKEVNQDIVKTLTEIEAKLASKIPAPVHEIKTIEKTVEVIEREAKVDYDKIIDEVLAKLPVVEEVTGAGIVVSINELPIDDENLKIDASHIKNLPKVVNQIYGNSTGIKELVAGSGVTIDNDNPQYPVINATPVSTGVTNVSVTTANGISGSVTNPTTTPAITLDINGLDTTKLADGSVTNAEFQYINSLTSNAQTQLDARVVGPATATDNAIARYDTTTGKLIQDSIVTISDTGVVAGASIDGGANTLTNMPFGEVSGMTTGSVPFAGATGKLTQDNANLFYDDTNNRLGIGTNTPTAKLSLKGDTTTDGVPTAIAHTGTPGGTFTGDNTVGYTLTTSVPLPPPYSFSYTITGLSAGTDRVLLVTYVITGAFALVYTRIAGTVVENGTLLSTGTYIRPYSFTTATSTLVEVHARTGAIRVSFSVASVTSDVPSIFSIDSSLGTRRLEVRAADQGTTGTLYLGALAGARGLFTANTSGFGVNALRFLESGTGLLALGYNSFSALTSGSNSTMLGTNSVTKTSISSLLMSVGTGISDFFSISSIGIGGSPSAKYSFNANVGTTTSSVTVPATALLAGTAYRVNTVGSTNFTLIGSSSNVTGTLFTATAAGTGTGNCILESFYNSNTSILTGSTNMSHAAGKENIVISGTNSGTNTGSGVYNSRISNSILLGINSFVTASGVSVPSSNLVVGKTYQILLTGTSNFVLAGALVNTSGCIFVATATTTGTGTATEFISGGITIGHYTNKNASQSLGTSGNLTYGTINSNSRQNLIIGNDGASNNRIGRANTIVGESAGGAVTSSIANCVYGDGAYSLGTAGIHYNGSLTVGMRYIIVSNGSNYVGIGAANNNIGTVFIATGTTAVGFIEPVLIAEKGFNTAFGTNSLLNLNPGGFNTAFGYNTLPNVTFGDSNTAVGYNTGLGITTGSNNTILGANVTGLSPTLSNNIILADGAGVQRINVLASGNAGVNVATPTANIHSKAGTITAGSAPLKMDVGVLLTTNEVGAVENRTDGLYYTTDLVSGRGSVPVEQYFRLPVNGALITTISNFFGANSAISVTVGQTYEIEINTFFLKTTTSAITWSLTNSASPTYFTAGYSSSPNGGIVSAPNANYSEATLFGSVLATQTITTGALTTAVNHRASFKIVLTASATGSFRLNLTSASGSVTPIAGSYWKCRILPATNIGTFAA
jgi:hypothetical protein